MIFKKNKFYIYSKNSNFVIFKVINIKDYDNCIPYCKVIINKSIQLSSDDYFTADFDSDIYKYSKETLDYKLIKILKVLYE